MKASLRTASNQVGLGDSPPGLNAIGKQLKQKSPVSFRKAARLASFDVSFRSFTAPKFRRDNVIGDLNNDHLRLVLTADRQVGNQHWTRGVSYDVAQALNTIEMDQGEWQNFIDDFPLLLDAVAQGYEDGKNSVVGFVGDLINEVAPGEPCGGSCRKFLKSALETAIASVGIPPSLPNTQQVRGRLIGMGAAYMAASLVDAAAPGVVAGIGDLGGPDARAFAAKMEPEVRKQAYDKLKGRLQQVGDEAVLPVPISPRPEDPQTWGVPDPFHQARPAVLYVTITPRVNADLSLGEGRWLLDFSSTFQRSTFDIAYMPPEGLTVPVVLWPTIGQFVEAMDMGPDFVVEVFNPWFTKHFQLMDSSEYPITDINGNVMLGSDGKPAFAFLDAGVGSPVYRTGGATCLVRSINRDAIQTVWHTEGVGFRADHNVTPETDIDAPVFGAVPLLRGP